MVQRFENIRVERAVSRPGARPQVSAILQSSKDMSEDVIVDDRNGLREVSDLWKRINFETTVRCKLNTPSLRKRLARYRLRESVSNSLTT